MTIVHQFDYVLSLHEIKKLKYRNELSFERNDIQSSTLSIKVTKLIGVC